MRKLCKELGLVYDAQKQTGNRALVLISFKKILSH